MSILERLSRLLRANVNDMISKAEDPGKIIEQSLRDMRDAYQQARSEVAESMAQLSKLEREQNTNQKIAQEYGNKAAEALKLGSEDLAREALRRKKNHEDLAAGFADQVKVHQTTVDQLKTQLRALEAKIDEMEAKKELLQARSSTAKASETLERMSGFDRSQGALNAFDEMERKVAAQEDRARAMGSLREEGDIDAQLRNLGRDAEIDAELEKLKQQIGGSSNS
ncbi:PspA/IM30 family protein [Deinococcus peraridilitoris]|uniref:Phage shock protein A (IM30), suppresses sigma54-dependent transcription n=1 Tax=Deinococcus peraridilitoris (strain DSM 19664 / LMG 22246 / CIP 109416 / KR-200) TaxID=937777 RepID=K9ZYG8_DEIPD|nr:PspA/IM30 family protein [Deinococcus peraridilitoris]AFZ65982.1 phage shock protein A (IM30), suppresses sigma54-dependent transcription [Deinococcus peraridilitoris DSM 19664]